LPLRARVARAGAAYWPISEDAEISAFGFADSKALSAARREALFARMRDGGRVGYVTHGCTAREISAEMLRRTPVSLNVLAHDATYQMLEAVLRRGVRVERVLVDTVGDAGAYQRRLDAVFNAGGGGGGGLQRRGWAIEFVVSAKADALFPCVSAASIAAKVTRDAAIHDWVFEEPALRQALARAAAAAAAAAAAEAEAAGAGGAAGGAGGGDMSEEAEAPAAAAAPAPPEPAPARAAAAAAPAAPTASTKRAGGQGRGVIGDSDDEAEAGDAGAPLRGTAAAAAAAGAAAPDAAASEPEAGEDEAWAPSDNEEEDAAAEPAAAASSSSSSSSSSSAPTTVAKRRRGEGPSAAEAKAAAGVAALAGVALHPRTAGNGYPSDVRTKLWMRRNLDPVFGWPSIVRFSWKPAALLLEKEAVRVAFEGDDDDAGGGGGGEGGGGGGGGAQPKLFSFFSSSSAAGAAAGGGGGGAQCAFLRKRRIEGVSTAAF